jgi:signal peptidase I
VSRRRRLLIGGGIALLVLSAVPVGAFLFGIVHRFYIPSESMLPTLHVGDRFIAWMRAPDPIRRGQIVLFAAPSGRTYIQRIAGLPGDRIALRDGVVFLDGVGVPQRLIRTERLATNHAGQRDVRRLSEQFPGEAEPHEIYDAGPGQGDDTVELIVPPGHVFLLGDNRDDSADSRYSAAEMGAGGPVPVTRILGVPWLFY